MDRPVKQADTVQERQALLDLLSELYRDLVDGREPLLGVRIDPGSSPNSYEVQTGLWVAANAIRIAAEKVARVAKTSGAVPEEETMDVASLIKRHGGSNR